MSKYAFAELADTLTSNKVFTRLSQASGRPISTIRRLWQESSLEAQDQGLYPVAETYDIYVLKSIRGKLGLKLDNNIDGSILRFPEVPEPIERPRPLGGFQGYQATPVPRSPIQLQPAASRAHISGHPRTEVDLVDIPLTDETAAIRYYRAPRLKRPGAKRKALRLTSVPKRQRKKIKLSTVRPTPGKTKKRATSKTKTKGSKRRRAVSEQLPNGSEPISVAQISAHAATMKELRPKLNNGNLNDGEARRFATAAGALIGYHSHMATIHGLRGDPTLKEMHLSARDKYLKETEAALKHTGQHNESAAVALFAAIQQQQNTVLAQLETASAKEVAMLTETAKKKHKKRHQKASPHVVIYTNTGDIHSWHPDYDTAEQCKMDALKAAPGEPLACMSHSAVQHAASQVGNSGDGTRETAKTLPADRYHWHRYNHPSGANLKYRNNVHKMVMGMMFGVRPATSPKAMAAGHHRLVLKHEGLNKVFTVSAAVHRKLLSRSKPIRVQKTDKKPLGKRA